MTKTAEDFIDLLIELNPEELKGELSSKSGKKYEDIASFYIIEQFKKVTKKKIKPEKIIFNSPEDITIIDNLDGIHIFQIKKNSQVWDKSDIRLINFLIKCFNRYLLKEKTRPTLKLKQYFFTNSTGRFLIDWMKSYKSNPLEIYKNCPHQLRNKIKESNVDIESIKKFIENIFFIVDQKVVYLKFDIPDLILLKFKEFKENLNPGITFHINDYNNYIFEDIRIKLSKRNNPAREKDKIISNAIEIRFNQTFLYCGKILKGKNKKDIESDLNNFKKRYTWLYMDQKLYTFQEFNSNNPLTSLINKGTVQKVPIKDLEKNFDIYFLNLWITNYIKNLKLKIFKQKYKKIFYFHRYYNEYELKWRDPFGKRKIIKNFPAVKFRESKNKKSHYYDNLAFEAFFNRNNDDYFLLVKPRILYTSDGVSVLDGLSRKRIDRKYQKSFMKNDFLRRRLFAICSFLKQDVIMSSKSVQSSLHEFPPTYSDKNKKRSRGKSKIEFIDKDKIKLLNLFEIDALFKPNNEAIIEKDNLLNILRGN